MWKKPDNIPDSDWQQLTEAWATRKGDVYKRFLKYTDDLPAARIDRILSGLLGLYYKAEQNAKEGADFFIQLRDEFNKGFWFEYQIEALRQDYPCLQAKTEVRFASEVRQATVADKCMGGIVKAFMDITREVCTERFGQLYGDKPKALRNGVLERSSWSQIFADYADQYTKYLEQVQRDPHTQQPPIYRQ